MDGPIHKLQGHEAVLTELAPLTAFFSQLQGDIVCHLIFFPQEKKYILITILQLVSY